MNDVKATCFAWNRSFPLWNSVLDDARVCVDLISEHGVKGQFDGIMVAKRNMVVRRNLKCNNRFETGNQKGRTFWAFSVCGCLWALGAQMAQMDQSPYVGQETVVL